MRKTITGMIMLALAVMLPQRVAAQAFDPRQPLAILISAFQMCGPPQAYSLLAPNLFQGVYQQTGGTGCYADIAGAGPVTGMQMLGAQDFPIGPLYLIRVSHASGAVADWFIGFNRNTGQVEFLRFQAPQTSGPPPSINTGPAPGSTGPSPMPAPQPAPSGGGGTGGGTGGTGGGSSGCKLYPAMCD